MTIADKLEYEFRRYLNQGSHPSCSTHAFLGVLAEKVEQDTEYHTDFDYKGEYDKLNTDSKDGINIAKLARLLTTKGFKTLDGRLVKSSKVLKVGKYQGYKKHALRLCERIQQYSPAIVTLRYNTGTSLITSTKDGLLTKVFNYVRKIKPIDNKSHAIAITGFDRVNMTFTITNSWGDKNSKRYIKWSDLHKIYGDAHFITDIIVTNK